MNLTGNTVLITGGGSGIGLELARQLARRGNKIIITGRDQEKLKKAEQEISGLAAIRSDASDPKDIDALYDRIVREFPATNILINNAGFMRSINLNEAKDVVDLTREIETNLMGPIRLSVKFLPHLKTKPAAAVVNVSSGLAFVPLPISPIYCATKAGLHSFSQSLRVQLKGTSVQVFELAPPATQTDMLGQFESEDMKGVSIMRTEDMVADALRAMDADCLEIRPGQANQLKFMSRLAPDFILKQMSRSAERMLSGAKR